VRAENLGQHYRYIEKYAVKARKAVPQACLEVFSDVEKVLGLILKGEPAALPASVATG
jgi:hypothetical protein